MTKTEREVWVAAFAACRSTDDDRLDAAWAAVRALRYISRRPPGLETPQGLLREVLAADGGENG
jgi:hypothetical protein